MEQRIQINFIFFLKIPPRYVTLESPKQHHHGRGAKMKKIIAVVLCVVLALACVGMTSCGDAADKQSVDAIKKAGKLTMYTNAEFPPFEYIKGSEAVGFDVSMSKLIAKDLNKKLQVVDMSFDGLIAAVQSGAVDFVAAGMTATDERRQNVDFSEPYYESNQVIIVRK